MPEPRPLLERMPLAPRRQGIDHPAAGLGPGVGTHLEQLAPRIDKAATPSAAAGGARLTGSDVNVVTVVDKAGLERAEKAAPPATSTDRPTCANGAPASGTQARVLHVWCLTEHGVELIAPNGRNCRNPRTSSVEDRTCLRLAGQLPWRRRRWERNVDIFHGFVIPSS
jgi:hypothetical protein